MSYDLVKMNKSSISTFSLGEKGKILFFVLLLTPLLVQAESLSDIYWSPYMCDGNIYHFDEGKGEYEIYTYVNVKDKKRGEYKSYQFAEGIMTPKESNKYILSSKDIDEAMTLDLSNMSQAILTSNQSKRRELLIRCDSKKAKMLIQEAERYFESCPKNVLNCKSP